MPRDPGVPSGWEEINPPPPTPDMVAALTEAGVDAALTADDDIAPPPLAPPMLAPPPGPDVRLSVNASAFVAANINIIDTIYMMAVFIFLSLLFCAKTPMFGYL